MEMKKLIAVGIILLFIGTTIIPSNGQDTSKSSSPTSRGNTLYVGGSGPGNYTTIKDAVDNATDGDTVFVYSGFYNESRICLNNSIIVLGENKNTTIIDGRGYSYIFCLKESCEISGFTFQNSKIGIDVESNQNNVVHDNIIRNTTDSGILLIYSNYNVIFENIVYNNNGGIALLHSFYNIIQGNILTNNTDGIYADFVYNNSIIQNSIKNSTEHGIYVVDSFKMFIHDNEIIQNNIGIDLTYSGLTIITKNNIYHNKKNAGFYGPIPNLNVWARNYWGLRLLPIKIIKGVGAIFKFNQFPPQEITFPWLDFDLFPRWRPYNI